MGSIMRAPEPDYTVTIPLNGRTLQQYDCIVLLCDWKESIATLFIYEDESWLEVVDTTPSISVSDDSIIIDVGYEPGSGFYACFIPSPIST